MRRKNKFIYFFASGKAEGGTQMRDLLGGKGAELAEMAKLGFPVPPGFTITTSVCSYYERQNQMPFNFNKQLNEAIKRIEKIIGKEFGSINNPLLFSVRSGAKFSMPGMMDTILNLGLNDKTINGLIKETKNARFAYDSYRRLIQMFGNVVLGLDKKDFEKILEKVKNLAGIKNDLDLSERDLRRLVFKYKQLIQQKTKKEFPQNPSEQLKMAIEAVLKSWNNPRAKIYRQINKIPEELGTAVTVQSMVFGNLGDKSATGVGFTRNPATGENKFYGEYLINAQGEDVVAGIRTPNSIDDLKKQMPKIYRQLYILTKKLEKHYQDVQDFEFTIEQGRLYILQTRRAKRTAQAAVKTAVDMVRERIISKKQAVMRLDPEQVNQLLYPIIEPKSKIKIIAQGLAASPGVAVGRAVFSAEEAILKARKEPVILIRNETCSDDIKGLNVAQGILTARGGITSHAAVVARGMGKCAVVGCEAMKINEKNKKVVIGNLNIRSGDWLTLDGNKGEVILGRVRTVKPRLSQEFLQFMQWVDKFRRIKIRANADNPQDARIARNFGAEGIGLCRTEHMFFSPKRLPLMQKMILTEDREQREKILKKLLLFQKQDFKGIFKEMNGLPVTIRTLDPPLHEFLPQSKKESKELSKKIKIPYQKIWRKCQELKEVNPMLGHRGCRLGITYPEITRMQTEAIILAACESIKENIKVEPEIMIPLVSYLNEFVDQQEIIKSVADKIMGKHKVKVKYKIGTMIEVPRAALIAEGIAQRADFFSFGTNDLTQMGLGFSRDDAGKFIKIYLEKGILKNDPFRTLDRTGIGRLMEFAVESGRKGNKDLKIGICGEHGGDPESIKFCCQLGMNYVSCSPYRLFTARISAAQFHIFQDTSFIF